MNYSLVSDSWGIEEKNAAIEVIESGDLSQFLGVWHDDFFGGPKVRELEKNFGLQTLPAKQLIL